MSTQTLQDLASTLTPPTPAQIDAVFASADPVRFAAVGKRFASDPVITDTSRLYGLAAAFWALADADQKDLLVGFSDGLLSVAVHTALELERKQAAFDNHEDRDRARRSIRAAELGDTWTRAIRRRDLAAKALAVVAGNDPTREAMLTAAVGTADDADELVRGLEQVAELARLWSTRPELADIVKLTRIDAAWIDRLTAVATALREAAVAQRSRMSVQVTQGALDELDGRNLYLLKLIVDLFEDAHDIDPAIPKLIPIAVSRYFGTRKKKDKAAEPAPTPPSEKPPESSEAPPAP